jgi:hypothetical protein
MTAEAPPHPPTAAELRTYKSSQLRDDLNYLRRGANHLRFIAWFILVPSVFGCFCAFLMLLMRPVPGSVFFFIITVFFIVVSCFYFALSSYIRRARRWAVYLALVVALLPIAISLPFLLQPQVGLHRRSPVTVLVETLYLIGHVNMIKDLVYCLGAIDRIVWAAALRFPKTRLEPEPWQR